MIDPVPDTATAAAPASRVRIDVYLDPAGSADPAGAAADRGELRRALSESPPRIPSRFFYDDRGSELFERITELPEYYQTRTEAALLEQTADRIVETSGATELVEIGSGAATKTRILLDAMERAGRLTRYVPMDVSEGTVRRVADELAVEYPGVEIHGLVGDFLRHLDEIPEGGRRLVIFLGGTIGNLAPAEARGFLRRLHDAMGEGDSLLLGTDLIKDVALLEAAYDDAQGVTAEFNLNVLDNVNRSTGGDFDRRRFRHRAFYDRDRDWIEMRLVATEPQTVRLPGLGLTLELAPGDEILTEISAKYDRDRATRLLADGGFELVEWYTDPDDLFGLSLARRG
jgi:L-histidine N-alpha-methyltransferase